VALFGERIKRDTTDLPEQPSDDDLLAWGRELSAGRPKRLRPLVAAPLDAYAK